MISSSHCANISHTETITHYVPHPKKLGLGIKMTRIWQGKVCRTLCSTNRERRKTTSSSSYTLDQPSLELEPGMKTRFANKQVNCSQSQMKLSFTCAFTTTVKHGRLQCGKRKHCLQKRAKLERGGKNEMKSNSNHHHHPMSKCRKKSNRG